MKNNDVSRILQGLTTESGQNNMFEQLKEMEFKYEDVRENLKLQLKAFGNISANLNLDANSLDTMIIPKASNEEVPKSVMESIEFTQNQWGLVLVLGEPAVEYIQKGGDISGYALTILAGAAGFIPIAGPALAVLCELLSLAISGYSYLIKGIDKGNGVYLTETWGQLVAAALWLTFAPIILIPVIGPIE